MSLIDNFRKLFRADGYDAADRNRHRRALPAGRRTPRDEDRLIGSWDRIKLRQMCLDLMRNNPIVAGLVERFSDNVVGSGIVPQAKTSSNEWNNLAEAYWQEWSNVCDLRQRQSMREMQRLIVRHKLFSGDMLFVLTKGGQIQPVEGERISTPRKLKNGIEDAANVMDGVRVDPATGITLGYYVFNRTDRGTIDTNSDNWRYIRREDAIYCGDPFRFDQVRAVPKLAPAVGALRDISELSFSMLERARMDAMRSWAIKRDGANGPGNLGPRMVRGSGTNDVDNVMYERFENGMTYYLRPGESAESLASNTPNSQYVSFFELNLRIVGACLGLPYEFVLLDFSEGSFSSSRAALLQTYRTFTSWQESMTKQFLKRLWNWRIAKAIKAGDLPQAPLSDGVSEWFRVEWSYPEFGWVDPNSESLSEMHDFNLGKKSLDDIVRKTGRDVEDVLKAKARNLEQAAMLADSLNRKYVNQTFNWTDIINATASGGHQQIEGSTAKNGGGQKGLNDE